MPIGTPWPRGGARRRPSRSCTCWRCTAWTRGRRCTAPSDTIAAEGLRPHSAIGAASGVAAPLKGGPSGDFCKWSSDASDSSSDRDHGPRIFRGLFSCPAAVPARRPGRESGARREPPSARSGATRRERDQRDRRGLARLPFPRQGRATRPERQRAVQPPSGVAKGVRVPLNSGTLFRAGGL